MCIIVVKPAGHELPTWGVLEKCFKNNPDGAGFMYAKDGLVHIRKGFMSFSEFRKEFREEKKHFDFVDSPVVFHFRIKTHGEVSKECCHPFPVSTDLERLRKTEMVVKFGAAHNGIISGRNTSPKKSDTMDYIMNVVAPLCKLSQDPTRDKNVKLILSDTLGGANKFVLLDGDYGLLMVGNFIEDNGCYFSNSTYNTSRYTYKPTSTYSGFQAYKGGLQTPKYFPLSQQETAAVAAKYYPKFKSCRKCNWLSACQKWGAECTCESDAYYMSDAVRHSERGEVTYPSDGAYDFSDWD